jgi:Skp family chaperone for outer membrane proteins
MKLRKVFSTSTLVAMTWAIAPLAVSAQITNNGLGVPGQPTTAAQPAAGAAQNPAAAPAAAQPAAGHLIAVVDMGRIFKEHPRFKAEIQQFDSDMKNTESQMKAEYERITAAVKQFKSDPKSPENRLKEADIARQQTEFEIKRTQSARDFQTRDSKMFLKFYLEIDEIVKTVAVRNNIAVVLRHNNLEVNPQDRNDIIRAVGKPILYAHPTLDITKLVFDSIPAAATAQRAPGAPGTQLK